MSTKREDVTVAVVKAALRGAAGTFGVRQAAPGEVEVISHATTAQHVAEQVCEASCILGRAGFDTFAAGGGRLLVQAREVKGVRMPWEGERRAS